MGLNLEREALYADAWKTPISDLAKRYGISVEKMEWACAQLRVPYPDKRYWEWLGKGRTMKVRELPPLVKGQATGISLDAVIQHMLAKEPPVPAKKKKSLIERVFDAKRASEPPVVIGVIERPDGYKWHAFVKPLKKKFEEQAAIAIKKKARFDWESDHPGKKYPSPSQDNHGWEYFRDAGQLVSGMYGKAAVRVSLRTYQRALVVLNEVCLRVADHGFSPPNDKTRGYIELRRGNAVVRLRLMERMTATNRPRTGALASYGGTERVLSPSGRLEMLVEQEGYGQSVVKDLADTPLENRIDKIFKEIEIRHQRSIAAIEERKIREQQYKEDEARRQEAAALREKARQEAENEVKRRDALVREAETWQKAELIRQYLAALDAQVKKGGVPAPDYETWKTWAAVVADDLDSRRVKRNAGEIQI